MLYIRKRKLVIRHRHKLSFIMSNKIQLRLIPFIYASNNNFKIKNEFCAKVVSTRSGFFKTIAE